jgi:hypothetical protein
MAGYSQNTDIDTAAEPLGTTAIVKTGVRIKALASNTGKIYVGNSDAVTATTGYELAAGQAEAFDVGWFNAGPGQYGDIADIYVIGSAANQGACFFWV